MVCKSKKDNRQRFSVPQHSRVDFAGGLLFIPKFKKDIKKPVSENKAIGIDLGISHFAVLSNGVKIDNPRYLHQSLVRLKRLQRSLSRKQKGGSNRDKARVLVAAQHQKVFNQRNDFLQKTTSNLLGEYDTL